MVGDGSRSTGLMNHSLFLVVVFFYLFIDSAQVHYGFRHCFLLIKVLLGMTKLRLIKMKTSADLPVL